MVINRNQLLQAILGLYVLAILVALGSFLTPSRLWRGKKTPKTQSGSVAILHIYGPIQTSMTSSAWGKQGADDLARRLHQWSKDDDIKAIVLRINSPGGTVGAVQEIYSEALKCKAKGKKIVASLGDVAASGGFYIASAADRVVANPGTITGSIGVLLQFGNLEGLFEKLGVRLQVVKSGIHKDIGSPARSLTPEERRLLQASIDDAYAQFVDAVSKGRSLDREKVMKLADGRIFTGREAQQVGLVDDLGDSQDALETAIRLANLSPQAPIVSDTPRFLRALTQRFSSESGFMGWLNSAADSSGFRLEYSLR